MKKILTIMFIVLNVWNIKAQDNKNIGYVTLEGVYNEKDKTYNENNIAGLILTFEQLRYEESNITTVKIEFTDGPISVMNEYVLMQAIPVTDTTNYNVYFLRSVYKEDIILKYNKTEFELWSNKQPCKDRETEWMNYYVGIFLN